MMHTIKLHGLAKLILCLLFACAMAACADKVQAFEFDSIEISYTELKEIGVNPHYPLDRSYKLMDSGTLSSEWLPIGCNGGSCSNPDNFTGKLDGNGQTIRIEQLQDEGLMYSGLFASIKDGVIENLTIDIQTQKLYYNGRNSKPHVGALAGMIRGSTIENVHIIGDKLDVTFGYIEYRDFVHEDSILKDVHKSLNLSMTSFIISLASIIVLSFLLLVLMRRQKATASIASVIAEPAEIAMNSLDSYLETCLLTMRERQVLDILMQGKTDKEIACMLDIAVGTVQTHLKRIYQKTETIGRFALIDKLESVPQS